MKKTFYYTAAIASLLISNLQARSWTNAAGDKSFEADYKGLNEETQEVTVYKKGMPVSFKLDVLSEADQKWVREQVSESKKPQTAIGKLLAGKQVLSQLEGDTFVPTQLGVEADFYILYYTASW